MNGLGSDPAQMRDFDSLRREKRKLFDQGSDEVGSGFEFGRPTNRRSV